MAPDSSPGQPDPALRVLRERPEECAYWTITRPQKLTAAGLGLALVLALLLRPVTALLVVNGVLIVFYLVHSAYKFYLVWLSLDRPMVVTVGPDELAALRDEDLPRYTVLIPLYREAAVLPALVTALGRLDYPTERLEIILLLEEEDVETRAACERMVLPAHFRPLVVPDSLPKTKPKACNHGLAASNSDFTVIYDAEDRPDPDQLKKAVLTFARAPAGTACVQA